MIQMGAIQLLFIENILPMLIFFAAAYLVHRFSAPLSQRFQPLGNLAHRDHRRHTERNRTLQALIANAISISAFIIATLASLTLYFDADSILWVVGLFSAAFGLGARPFISDFLTGVSFMFEDTFYVGDKIELPMSPQRVEGVVEKVTLRTTQIRGMDGELFTMPNGDIRLVRNFSRGVNSPTNITLKVAAEHLTTTLDHLESIAEKAMTRLPNLIEPWTVISKSGELGEEAELTILAKAKFGKGAVMRPRMLAYVQEELTVLKVTAEHIDEHQQD